MSEAEKKAIATILDELEKYPDEFLNSAQRILKAGSSKLYTLDFIASAVNNRAISLVKGFTTLIKSENYMAAVSLIRLQLDNALRFYASMLVKDSNDFAKHFMDGKPIKDYKDAYDKNLTDSYLAKKLDLYFKGTEKLYKDTCSFIHLSDTHLIPTLTRSDSVSHKVGIVVGNTSNFKPDQKIDFLSTMLEVSKLVIIVLEQWKHEKNKLSN